MDLLYNPVEKLSSKSTTNTISPTTRCTRNPHQIEIVELRV